MTINSKLVSVIMPVYNGEKFLAEAIDSLLNQTYQNWELVVIDDGSTDNTANITKSYADDRIKYRFQENQGQASALNHGLNLSQGDFVTTLDADDWYPPNSLGDRANFLAQNPDFGAVYGDGNYCNEQGENLLKFSKHMPNGINGDVYDMLIVSPFYGTGATVLIRKSILSQYKISYDESIVWCQDWDFYIRLAAKSLFGYVDSITINYRLHGEGMTVVMPKGNRLESLIRTRKKVINSPRFQRVSTTQKSAFFYDFVMKDLEENVFYQAKIFEYPQFKALPKNQQSRLLRIAAINYLLENKHTDIAVRWLRQAWVQSPLDPKTTAVTLLSTINIKLARSVIHLWQKNQPATGDVSPFELALSNDQSTS